MLRLKVRKPALREMGKAFAVGFLAAAVLWLPYAEGKAPHSLDFHDQGPSPAGSKLATRSIRTGRDLRRRSKGS